MEIVIKTKKADVAITQHPPVSFHYDLIKP
ncbi:hypothetical protein PEC301296_40800 [Pectobacterium carotovorum subsp. carotovorum]|nr:hypothetical protein PEC301296_40800 [Pectobacterium carotovorum subsp. carotovorum]